ncbi:sensor histidine kinase [Protofrankia symbiont of Coriaria ruscifolia]|uniref:histidine kinase n=1 Tax=Candidatus Protofrankia californiensis TaxID=1839754 RepID=A0A1C3NUJ0_9ACTN|nr:sensor histidine kinase [Protofrankia symbiont of Coriaria ruscifolia]SBW18914.1 hypothetical protein FDG2_0879 [Candidatus Protofrankia californiensis]
MSVTPPTPDRPRPREVGWRYRRWPGSRRSGLALRTALLTTAVATLTAVLTGTIFLRLIGGTADEQARRTLDRQAELVAQLYDRPARAVEFRPGAVRILAAQQITVIRVDGEGTVMSSWGSRIARRAVLPADVLGGLAAGDTVSRVRTVTGDRVNIAARPLPAGGAVVLAQPASQGRELSVPVSRRLTVALLDGLAENALRVVPTGAPIVFALRKEGKHAVIEVRDAGPGLTAEDCAVAFERSLLYERYRGIRPVSTGLGLALVAGLTARLGGQAEAGTAPEGGAAFTIRLPTAG